MLRFLVLLGLFVVAVCVPSLVGAVAAGGSETAWTAAIVATVTAVLIVSWIMQIVGD